MNLRMLPVVIYLLWTGFAQSSVFFDQNEGILTDRDTPFINLRPYFQNVPKTFGLVSDKSRVYFRGGYLCYA